MFCSLSDGLVSNAIISSHKCRPGPLLFTMLRWGTADQMPTDYYHVRDKDRYHSPIISLPIIITYVIIIGMAQDSGPW